MTERRVTFAERRARLGCRHRLVDSGSSVESVVDDLVVLHATDPATIYLSVGARVEGAAPSDVERSLFEDRTTLRTLAMRRTLFVPTVGGAAAVEASSSIDVAAIERRRLEQFLSDSDIDEPTQWLDDVAGEVSGALADAGPDGFLARELTAAVPRLGTRILMGRGTKHPVDAPATSRVLGVMAVEGRLVRGRPSGDWTGRQYRWHRRDRWWPDGEGPASAELDPEEAARRLLGRYVARFGPVTVVDTKWWTGWTMTKTRRVLAELDVAEVELVADDGGAASTGYLLADDLETVEAPEPWAALLPSLDPTPMGWKERDWYLDPDHIAELFDRNGNVGPTVWVDGRIVGGWSQRPDGEVVTTLLATVDAERRTLIDAAADRVAGFVGPTVVKPSFPTPLQKRLSAPAG
ncbi:MAG: winged helix DNA-binding domain-containing protein [Actinomycetota bacterium]